MWRVRGSRRANDDAEYRALFDPATRLVKPALLRDRLGIALARASREKLHVAVLYVQVVVPSELRHARTRSLDVLPLIAGRLRSAVRPDDTVGRVGEHDFVIVCNDLANDEEADRIAERIRQVIALKVFLDDGRPVLAADVAVRVARAGDDVEKLLAPT